MKEYLFDVKLFSAIRISAENEKEARRILAEHTDCAFLNLGSLPNGQEITGEASTDGEAELIEIDGECV